MTWKKTACILCSENCGIKIKVEGTSLSKIRGDEENPESRGYLCQKAARLDYYQNHSDRLDTPLAKQSDGSFKAISWDQAIEEIAQKLVHIRDQHGGKTIAYYGGGGQGNHLGGVYGASLREAIGTPFLYTALAQEKTGDFWVNGKLFGKQTCHITSDVENAQFVMFLGTNPFQSHGFPRARQVLKEIKGDPSRTMVVVDPRRTETARMADIHLQLRPGTDAYLLAAILAIIVEQGLIDQDFLSKHCTEKDEILSQLKQIPITDFITKAGLDETLVRKVATSFATAESASVRADLGLQQSFHSSLNSYLEKLLFLLTGHFGKKGGNALHSFLMPLIGHSPEPEESQQSVRTFVTKMKPISKIYPPNILPQEIESNHPKHTRALIIDSANPIISAADTKGYQRAFRALELLVVIDVAMTESAMLADYVLPASSQFEKTEATFFCLKFPSNAFHLRKAILPARSNTLPEPEIYRRLCVAMGALPNRFPVLEAVARYGNRKVFSLALKAFFALNPKLINMAPLVLYSTLGKSLGADLQSAAVLWASAHHYAKRHPDALRNAGISGKDLGESLFKAIINSPSGLIFSLHNYEDTFSFIRHPGQKIHLDIPVLLEELEALSHTIELASEDFPFQLMAGERRSYNANTIYRDSKWRKTDHNGAMQIHPNDAQKIKAKDGDKIRVISKAGQIEVTIKYSDDILRGVLSIPHGHGLAHPDDNGVRTIVGPRINELTSADHCDTLTKTPFHKNVPVRIEKI